MRTILFFTIAVLFFSCDKKIIDGKEKVEIYLLRSHNTVGFKCEVDPSTAVLENDPIISNDDIIRYHKYTHTFIVKEAAVKSLQQKGGRIPFAVTVDKKVIYYGFYMPSIMSSTCEHSITMKETSDTKILMSLGYPFDYKDNIIDKRNDPALLKALNDQGKLR